MKKTIILCLALLLIIPVLGGCSKKKTTDTPEPESPSIQSSAQESVKEDSPSKEPSDAPSDSKEHSTSEPTPADGVLSTDKSGKTLTVKITLADQKNEQVSLVLLDDLSHKADWSENPEHLIDLAQLTLNEQGEGTVTLQLKDENAVCHLLLTTTKGSYSVKING
ncbi:MAG: hypothetical protein J6M12_05840 [Clostridia bacterium]|nr:hypothetical protein [Clostridia bacterium]